MQAATDILDDLLGGDEPAPVPQPPQPSKPEPPRPQAPQAPQQPRPPQQMQRFAPSMPPMPPPAVKPYSLHVKRDALPLDTGAFKMRWRQPGGQRISWQVAQNQGLPVRDYVRQTLKLIMDKLSRQAGFRPLATGPASADGTIKVFLYCGISDDTYACCEVALAPSGTLQITMKVDYGDKGPHVWKYHWLLREIKNCTSEPRQQTQNRRDENEDPQQHKRSRTEVVQLILPEERAAFRKQLTQLLEILVLVTKGRVEAKDAVPAKVSEAELAAFNAVQGKPCERQAYLKEMNGVLSKYRSKDEGYPNVS